MAEKAREQIESLVEQVFNNRKDTETKTLDKQLSAYVADHNRRGVLRSGFFCNGVGKLYGELLNRVLDQTLEQLETSFRQAGRKDGTFFWNAVQEKLIRFTEPVRTSLNNQAVDFVHRKTGNTDGINGSSLASRGFCQFGDQVPNYLITRIAELRLRSNFIAMKSAADRKANNIPDVAVMMWFPTEKKNTPEQVAHAKLKYDAIVEAVKEASSGLATVDKIDNPSLVHKDRISPAVENWLSKSVLVICDLEGNRPNVFYEFGFARATGTDVIATRPEGCDTDFHLAQWTLDEYRDLTDLKTKIVPRIQRTLANYDLSGSI